MLLTEDHDGLKWSCGGEVVAALELTPLAGALPGFEASAAQLNKTVLQNVNTSLLLCNCDVNMKCSRPT